MSGGSEPGFAPKFSASHRSHNANLNRPWRWGTSHSVYLAKIKQSPMGPWVRKIHFVTSGQKPEWLDENNPKLNLVSHKDYIPAQFLPTYNSVVIERYIHKIPGLADHFVYFNVDIMFICRYNTEKSCSIPGFLLHFFTGGIHTMSNSNSKGCSWASIASVQCVVSIPFPLPIP